MYKKKKKNKANEGIEAIEKYKNNELVNIMKNMVDRKF